jgi:serine/threonine protein kinase
LSADSFNGEDQDNTRQMVDGAQTAATGSEGVECHKGKADELVVGEIIGDHYQVLGWLGSGAMGSVYRVRHDMLQQEYALKTISQQDPERWRRFQNEAQAIARLSHPNLISIYNFGLHRQRPYYVMDLLDGLDLGEKLKRDGALDAADALPIFIEVCAGIGYAHSKGVVHRDIKPSNIVLLKPKPGISVRSKVLDFGIAKLLDSARLQDLTRAGEVFGTPFYMSPEQCQGKAVDSRSDIYSLGCTIFETLSAELPIQGGNALETMLLHVSEAPRKLSQVSGKVSSPELELILARTLAKDPAHRYQTMEHLGRDLGQVLQARPLSRKPEGQALTSETFGSIRGTTVSHANATADGDAHTGASQTTSIIRPVAYLGVVLLVVAACFFVGGVWIFAKRSSPPAPAQRGAASTVDSREVDSPGSAKQQHAFPKGVLYDKIDHSVRQVASASLKVRAPFSSLGDDFGYPVKNFTFPDDVVIGQIGKMGEGPYAATGKLAFPPDVLLQFSPDEIVTQPYKINCLQRFKRGDIFALRIKNCPVSDQLLILGADIPGVCRLDLSGASLLTEKIGPALAKFDSVEFCDVSDTGLSGIVVARLGCWDKVRTFYYAHGKAVEPVIEKLPQCRHLTKLGFKGCVLSSRDFALLASCRGLTNLDLDDTNLRTADLKGLARLPKLSELCLRNTPLDKSALPVLRHFKALKHLYILTPSTDPQLVGALRGGLPGVEVN